ncbi:hypothetical protein V6N13_106470 [Hibiscus sabdariffa]|uniref:Uncharacterized protein n=1 Tax=Hibiscus sabdariffa TaxID=183260 RepID=A0ABR2F0S3_9ROSI
MGMSKTTCFGPSCTKEPYERSGFDLENREIEHGKGVLEAGKEVEADRKEPFRYEELEGRSRLTETESEFHRWIRKKTSRSCL